MAGRKWKKRIDSDPRSFRRPRGSKPPAKAILIVTEGEVTEPVYFEALKRKLNLLTVEIEVVGAGKGDPRRLAEAALEERKQRRKEARRGRLGFSKAPDFDELWIVFDTDVPVEHGRYHDGVGFASATLAALPLILGDSRKDDADYLDACRAKRNTAEYDTAGTVSRSEAAELRAFASELRSDVIAWLKKNHPNLIPTP